MPLKPHPTDTDKMVYASRWYDIPQLQGVITAHRPWVDLTDKEIWALHDGYPNPVEFARAVEAKLKERNAQE